MLRHANHLLSADYINYGKISIQIKDKFGLEMRDSTNEGKTTSDVTEDLPPSRQLTLPFLGYPEA